MNLGMTEKHISAIHPEQLWLSRHSVSKVLGDLAGGETHSWE